MPRSVEKTDVFVVGGGPAGLAAAIAARKKGFDVIVADGGEPGIDKTCGEGLMPETQSALSELGVRLPCDKGYAFRGFRFIEKQHRTEARFPVGQGIGMRRTILHQILAGHAEAMGIRLLWKTPVAGVEDGAARLKDGSVRARWIIGADGGQSRARRWSGLESSRKGGQRIAWQRHYRMQPWSEFVEIHWAPGLQAYVTPTSPEEICVVTLGESAGDADFDRVLGVLPELRQRLASAEWIGRKRGAITETRSLARVWRGNIALVGDASGSVDAITGEGMRLAFQQAVALAEALQRNDLRSYERAHRRLARRPSLMSTLLLQLGQHDSVRRRVLSVFSRKNEIFEKFLAFHVGKATAVDLVKTGAQLSWQFLTAGG